MSQRFVLALLAAATIVSTAACGGPPTDHHDAGTPPSHDAGVHDAGTNTDAGIHDGGTVDAGPGADAGTDGGSIDAGPTAPETTIVDPPGGATALTTIELSFTSDDATATFECRLDTPTFTACTSPVSYSGLTDGTHQFYVRATSATTGLVDPTPAEAIWDVDTKAPDTYLDSGPTPTANGTEATFEFSSSDGDDTFECSVDSAPFAACATPFVITGPLSNGLHTFAVRAVDAAGNVDPTPASTSWTSSTTERFRVMAANLTSGNLQSYDPGEGIRIFQGLKPDVVLIQEFNYGTNSATDLRAFVDQAFGTQYQYAREAGGVQIPNGVISRYPILSSGEWNDPQTTNREFVWAQIDVPGTKDLWAVSMHLLTSSASTRDTEAAALVSFVNANVPAGDYLVIGGDFNTDVRTEACIGTLSQIVQDTPPAAPYPVDQNGLDTTSGNRSKPYDWVLADADLNPYEVPVVIGSSTYPYPTGLVFDSRVYTPLSEVAPVMAGDSAASNMQHMAVVKDFVIPK